MALDADRVSGLARTKLEVLVRRTFPHITADAEGFNAGVGLVQGEEAFVYLINDAPSPLAAVLAWGSRRGASQLHVVADSSDPMLSAMAAGLEPAPTLWEVDGTELKPMRASALSPGVSPSPDALRERQALEDAGCDVVVEHGVVIGEVLGLEVARVVVEVDGRTSVRVGVGLYDQEAHALMHADASTEERLALVIAEVKRHRHGDARPHPINRVARERWLRSLLVAEPALVGLDSLGALQPLVPRGGIHEERPVGARGMAGDDEVLVVCSTGIDLDLVPVAAAHVAQENPDRVILVLPQRDHHEVIKEMSGQLAAPSTLTSIPDPWKA